MNLRLDKYLANSRAGSRSEVKEHIRKGRVTVNGTVCRDNSRYIEETDEVCLDGRRIVYKEHVYYMCAKSLHSCLTLCITQTLIHCVFSIHGILKTKK